MKYKNLISLTILLQAPLTMFAYPPAPSIVIKGLIKDTFGDRWSIQDCEVVLFSEGEEFVKAPVLIDYTSETNYQLSIPFDSGIKVSNYRPTALRPYSDITLQVRLGSDLYLPIEMSAPIQLTEAGAILRIDLTIGEDTDQDGLPDLWEEWQLSEMGIYRGDPRYSLSLIAPDGDSDGDGVSNYIEYIAGTYAMDSTDRISLVIKEKLDNLNLIGMEFLGIKGRIYWIEASEDMKTWAPIGFAPVSTGATKVQSYGCNDTRYIMAYVPTDESALKFYRLGVK